MAARAAGKTLTQYLKDTWHATADAATAHFFPVIYWTQKESKVDFLFFFSFFCFFN